MSNDTLFQDKPNILPGSLSKQIVGREWHWQLFFVLPCEEESAESRMGFWNTYMSQVARSGPWAGRIEQIGACVQPVQGRTERVFFSRPDEDAANKRTRPDAAGW
jgi:hypothetical protein